VPALRLRVEFHLFLTALSVRPGSSLAIADHLLPFVSCAWGNKKMGTAAVRMLPLWQYGCVLDTAGTRCTE
jgi:hypothetical protein